jgi:hypothetical protein
MTSSSGRAMKTLRAGLAGFGLAFAVLGCSAGSVPAPSTPPASLPPDAPVAVDPGAGNVGGGGAGIQPGQPTLVLPKPGQQNVHDVSIEELTARVAGRHVVLNARWWSGVEPCSVLDSVAVSRSGQTITVSVREGSGKGDVMCPDIAMLKVTPIDLGDLEPGDYTIAAQQGPAPAIVVTVS